MRMQRGWGGPENRWVLGYYWGSVFIVLVAALMLLGSGHLLAGAAVLLMAVGGGIFARYADRRTRRP